MKSTLWHACDIHNVAKSCVSDLVFQTFTGEFPIFLKEHHDGMYRVDIYYLCKTLAEVNTYCKHNLVYHCLFQCIIRNTTGYILVCFIVLLQHKRVYHCLFECIIANTTCISCCTCTCISLFFYVYYCKHDRVCCCLFQSIIRNMTGYIIGCNSFRL